ncbi:MAG: transposase [Gammaproteobacteria bacterium]
MDTRKHYPTDLSDGQWSLVERQVPQSKSGPGERGRPSSDLRRVVNGVLYVNKTGCQWRMLAGGHRQVNVFGDGKVPIESPCSSFRHIDPIA